MLQQLTEHIDKHFSFLKEKELLIAISGGIDSVVLTHLLHQLNFTISLAHCNFQLRDEESNLDELFVKKLAKKLNIPFFSVHFDTIKYAKEHNFSYILTGHHADDNLETFIINLTRGTGLDGLTGIPAVNGKIIRPLLNFSREEIKKYAVDNNILWREDASNSETKYIRNKIRHQVIPLLKELNPNFLKTHHKTTSFLKQSQQIITDKVKEVSAKTLSKQGNILKINILELLKLADPKIYLYQLLKAYKFTKWNDVYDLIYAESGKKVATNSFTLLKDRDFLLLLPANELNNTENEEVTVHENEIRITNPISLLFEQSEKKTINNTNCIFVDKILLNYPLVIRKQKAGDYFYPTGMLGKKKVSKYFKDEKLSLFDKNNTWLLCSNNDEIIWIIGRRQDKRFLPSNKTTQLLRITN